MQIIGKLLMYQLSLHFHPSETFTRILLQNVTKTIINQKTNLNKMFGKLLSQVQYCFYHYGYSKIILHKLILFSLHSYIKDSCILWTK